MRVENISLRSEICHRRFRADNDGDDPFQNFIDNAACCNDGKRRESAQATARTGKTDKCFSRWINQENAEREMDDAVIRISLK